MARWRALSSESAVPGDIDSPAELTAPILARQWPRCSSDCGDAIADAGRAVHAPATPATPSRSSPNGHERRSSAAAYPGSFELSDTDSNPNYIRRQIALPPKLW